MSRKQHTSLRSWSICFALNVGVFGYFGYALVATPSTIKASLLPGKTTHGHFQIELDCDACHASVASEKQHSSGNVMQDACNRCHADQLTAESDTHPAKKFNDPSNADMLATLNAQDCLTCHKEHVPQQTSSMGLTLPVDYCWHCHQDVGENRPSHQGMEFDSCATAGCHNYHDNRAIYEKYLDDHFGESDLKEIALRPSRNLGQLWSETHSGSGPLGIEQADLPKQLKVDETVLADWAQTSHAAAGVNCSGCHVSQLSEEDGGKWSAGVAMDVCQTCHAKQVETFGTGKHGMRLAAGLSPMQPSMARLPMHRGADHRELTCNACHAGHRFDTQYAAVTACQSCHADSHSAAYAGSAHAELWLQEQGGDLPAGSGVTCATCHLPRLDEGGSVWVNHDQNAVLRPSDTMARQICSHCHGLEYSLSALADPNLVRTCFGSPPQSRARSVQMAHDYFEQRRTKRKRRVK